MFILKAGLFEENSGLKCFALEHNVSKAKRLRIVLSHVLRTDFLDIHLLLVIHTYQKNENEITKETYF